MFFLFFKLLKSNNIIKFLKKIKHEYFLISFRFLYGVTGVFFSITSIEYIPLRWSHLDAPIESFYFLHFLWVFSSFLLIIKNSKINDIFHFIISSLILNKFLLTPIGFTVEHVLYLLISFYNIFLNKNIHNYRIEQKLYNQRVIFVLFSNLGIIFFLASLWKVNDPLWYEGNGFYSTLELNWLRIKSSNFLFDYKKLLSFFNYSAIFFQMTFLVGLFIKNISIRMIYFLGLSTFFVGLLYPMHLSFIGEIGLSYIILYILIIDYDTNDFITNKWLKFVFCYLIMFAIGISVFHIIRSDRAVTNKIIDNNNINKEKFSDYFKSTFKIIKNANISLFWIDAKMGLFNRWHNIGLYGFKVFVDGIEEYIVFDNDLYSGKDNNFYPRHYQSVLYLISDLIHKKSFDKSYQLNEFERIVINNIIIQNTKNHENFTEVRIRVKKFMTQLESGDNYWEDFIVFKDCKLEFYEINNKFRKQSRIKYLDNYFDGKNYH